jgi:hypothetical protein
LWGYDLSSGAREEELNQLLVESPGGVMDEDAQHDRSPLEAQREWRRQAENNVLDALQRDGFLAPPGDVDKLLDTIVNNLEVTSNLSGQFDLRCRVLLTSSLVLFSIENTIVISRGLIDVVPDQATLAAMLAQEVPMPSSRNPIRINMASATCCASRRRKSRSASPFRMRRKKPKATTSQPSSCSRNRPMKAI